MSVGAVGDAVDAHKLQHGPHKTSPRKLGGKSAGKKTVPHLIKSTANEEHKSESAEGGKSLFATQTAAVGPPKHVSIDSDSEDDNESEDAGKHTFTLHLLRCRHL